MICACTVTSSAVVGSSAISSRGLAASAMRDHHALPHAARELVRIVAEPPRRIGDAHAVERILRRAPVACRPVSPRWSSERLLDLRADGVHRVERGHRLLEDHADVVAADGLSAPALGAVGDIEDAAVLALQHDRCRR